MSGRLGHLGRLLGFAGYFSGQLLMANWQVVADLLTPGSRLQPGIVALPLRCRTAGEVTLLSNLITLTPGSVSLDLSEDRRVLYVHAMYIDGGDVEAYRRSVKDGLERRVLELLR